MKNQTRGESPLSETACCAPSISLRDALAYEVASSWWAPMVSWSWAQNLAAKYYTRKAMRKWGRINSRIEIMKRLKKRLRDDSLPNAESIHPESKPQDMNQDQTESKPADSEQPSGKGLDETLCYASSLARKFHDAYERLAPQFGYETRPDTKVYDPDTPNGRLMAAVCVEVMAEFMEQLRAIAEMPEYDQDDAHRLRGMARRFLSHNAQDQAPAPEENL
jgi:hypothetical protein